MSNIKQNYFYGGLCQRQFCLALNINDVAVNIIISMFTNFHLVGEWTETKTVPSGIGHHYS